MLALVTVMLVALLWLVGTFKRDPPRPGARPLGRLEADLRGAALRLRGLGGLPAGRRVRRGGRAGSPCYAPDLRYEKGTIAVPVDFRCCRATACGDRRARPGEAEPDAGELADRVRPRRAAGREPLRPVLALLRGFGHVAGRPGRRRGGLPRRRLGVISGASSPGGTGSTPAPARTTATTASRAASWASDAGSGWLDRHRRAAAWPARSRRLDRARAAKTHSGRRLAGLASQGYTSARPRDRLAMLAPVAQGGLARPEHRGRQRQLQPASVRDPPGVHPGKLTRPVEPAAADLTVRRGAAGTHGVLGRLVRTWSLLPTRELDAGPGFGTRPGGAAGLESSENSSPRRSPRVLDPEARPCAPVCLVPGTSIAECDPEAHVLRPLEKGSMFQPASHRVGFPLSPRGR